MAHDEAASDLVGTILLIALAVVLAGFVFGVVSDTLDSPSATRASFSLGASDPGATSASVYYRNGEAIRLADFRVGVQRNASPEQSIASLVTPDASWLKPGDRFTFALQPPLAEGERISVRLYQNATNQMLAELSSRAGSAGATLAPPSLSPFLSVPTLPNDSLSSAVLAVRVSHPQGALSVARIVADLSSLSPSLALDLNDAGENGDAAGGDGNWTALLRVPTTTPSGSFILRFNATDSAGAVIAAANLSVGVTPNIGFVTQSALTNASCSNCTLPGGARAFEGTRWIVPSSQNATALLIRNFTWDRLHPDRLESDSALFRITDVEHTFSVVFDFAYQSGVAVVTTMNIWTNGNETNYTPRNGTGIALEGLDLDVLNPVASLQWVVASGNADGSSNYQNAGVIDPATLIVEFLGDLIITPDRPPTDTMGLFTFDVVMW